MLGPARFCRRGKLRLIVPLFLHILLFLCVANADSLKFEDIDRWLEGNPSLEARATLAENAEFVASIPLPRGKEVRPFASGQVDANLLPGSLLSPKNSISSRYSIDGPRVGANWELGSIALQAGYSRKPNFDLGQAVNFERYDLSIQVSGFKFLTSLDLVGMEMANAREDLPQLKDSLGKTAPGLERSFLATKIGMNYTLANLALLKAGVEFVDLDALLQEETGLLTSAEVGFDAPIPGLSKTQVSAGYFFSGNTSLDNFVLEKSRAKAAVEVEVPGGGRLVVDCAIDGLGIDSLSSSFGLGYYFQPQAYFKLGYTKPQAADEKGQTAAELTIRF